MLGNSAGWIDITVPIRRGMPLWPGDPEIGLETVEKPDYRVTSLSMSVHTGTHIDAPRHFFAAGPSIDAMPLETGMGRARLIDTATAVGVEEVRRALPCERLLVRCGGYILPQAAEAIAAAGVRLVGVDSLSVDPLDSREYPAHKTLLAAGVWIVELLDLRDAEPGGYDLICLPMRIAGADGAPARVLIRPLAE
jgi:arylformamidase